MSENKDNINLKLYNVDTKYIKTLHMADCRVQYSETKDYSSKPFLGPFELQGGNYFIPLSSPKDDHAGMDYEGHMYFLVYEKINPRHIRHNDVIKRGDDGRINKILAILSVNNMIPVPEGYYSLDKNFMVSLLLKKQLKFCTNIREKIISKVHALYKVQKDEGIYYQASCNFTKLELEKEKYINR